MAIGGVITSATQGSVLFAGAAGVLAQDNANFFWNDTTNTMLLGASFAPLATGKLDVTAPTPSYSAGTGTISISNRTITGSGTAFLSELVPGSVIQVSAFGSYFGMVVAHVSSNTLAYIVLDLLDGYGPTAFEYSKPISNFSGAAGMSAVISDRASFDINTNANNVGCTLVDSMFMVRNKNQPQAGALFRTFAVDGRMALGHNQSPGSYILFQGGNNTVTLVNAGTTNLLAGGHTYLGRDNVAGNQTYLDVYTSGTGANQTIYMHAIRFANNNDAPSIQQASNGYDLGIRDGSLHNEGIDNIIFSMGKTNGNISLGLFGTSTPTEATTRLDFATVGETMGFKTGTNASIGTATLVGGTVTISTTKITANSMIVLSAPRGTLTNLGLFGETARTAGTSFTITSINPLDVSTFDWHLVEKI